MRDGRSSGSTPIAEPVISETLTPSLKERMKTVVARENRKAEQSFPPRPLLFGRIECRTSATSGVAPSGRSDTWRSMPRRQLIVTRPRRGLCDLGSELTLPCPPLGVAMQSPVQGTSVESNDISNRGDRGGTRHCSRLERIDLSLRIPIA